MRTVEDVQKELEKSRFLSNLYRDTKLVSKKYYQAGYTRAIEFCLGLVDSELSKKIKELTDFDNLVKILKDSE